MGDFAHAQDEDCLTLTIWTPAADAGGAPRAWSGCMAAPGAVARDRSRGTTARMLARDQGVVVVGVNYRLGALGYLHCPGISPGNLGTMDQVAALRWVRDHIAAFGGDPVRVTVGGQSAGAATIGRLIADPAARPLFRRAIMQSGGFGRAPLHRAEAAEIGARIRPPARDRPRRFGRARRPCARSRPHACSKRKARWRGRVRVRRHHAAVHAAGRCDR